jgi:hypothetical protein
VTDSTASVRDGLPDFAPVRPWVEAAGGLWLANSLPVAVPRDSETIFFRLLTLARAQYAADLAHARLSATRPSASKSDHQSGELVLAQAADAHTFLVSAALYWATLSRLANRLKTPNIRPLFAPYEKAASEAKTAREHIEHLNERIEFGRSQDYGKPMPVHVFRTAVGAFDGAHIKFGNEVFPIEAMLRAIRESSEAIAPVLSEATSPKFELRVEPPPETSRP